jgi:bifunctional enzyme CysN/CysC
VTNPNSSNIRWQSGVPRDERWRLVSQRGMTVWLTGLPGAGKSTLAAGLERELLGRGRFAYVLDGDNLRHGLSSDLGFDAASRSENVRRVGHVAALFADAGATAIAALVSPYRTDRKAARAAHEDRGLPFVEVFVDAPLEVCEQRDPKGQYRRAHRGEISHFTGVDDPYEAPEHADVVVPTNELDERESLQLILGRLDAVGR